MGHSNSLEANDDGPCGQVIRATGTISFVFVAAPIDQLIDYIAKR